MAKSKTTTGKSTATKRADAPKDKGAAAAKANDATATAPTVRPVDEAWVRERTRDKKGEAPSLGAPLSVFLGESLDCATFLRAHWEPQVVNGKEIVAGMKTAAKAGDGEMSFGLHTADEIVALHNLAQAAQTEYLLAAKRSNSAEKLMKRGAELLDQWTAALEWTFDDGVEDDKDAQLAAVRAANDGSADTIDGMASALRDYAGLAQKHLGELTGVLDFDPATLDEGLKLVAQLRDSNAALESNPAERAALARRNDLLSLLLHRVSRVRTAARLVYRGANADVARKVTSAYQRRARAAARRAKATDDAGKA